MVKIIIAGGGTGGHLFPGIALAQALCPKSEIRNPKSEILFLCTERPFDAAQLARYGFPYQIIPAPRFRWSLRFPLRLLQSFLRAHCFIRQVRPHYVIGLGGYGSFPALVSAKILGIPIILLEQNLLPGKVNRWLSAWARWTACQWAGTRPYLANPLRARLAGSPIRSEITRIDRATACQKLGLDPQRKILAILGGSQGAEAINQFISKNISLLTPYKDRLALIHLTGEKDYPALKALYEAQGLNHYVAAFAREMAEIYSCADMVIARAGGITIAELTALGIPAVLIPFPYAAENHQYFNAREFARSGAGLLVEQKDLNRARLKQILTDILFQPACAPHADRPAALNQMAQASRQLGQPIASTAILNLMNVPSND